MRAQQVVLVDPPGSSLFHAVTRGVAYAAAEAEGSRLRHPCDTITEGIGLNRLTANFLQAQARRLSPFCFLQAQARPRGFVCRRMPCTALCSWLGSIGINRLTAKFL